MIKTTTKVIIKVMKLLNYASLLSIFLFCGCSNITPITKRSPISRDEQLRLEAIEKYRILRLNDLRKKKNHKSNTKKNSILSSKSTHQWTKKILSFIPITEEMIVEAEQKSIWYCMKNEKNRKNYVPFESCNDFIINVQKSCEDKTIKTPGIHYVRCVTKKLNRKNN